MQSNRIGAGILLLVCLTCLLGCQKKRQTSKVDQPEQVNSATRELKNGLARLKIKRDDIQEKLDHLNNRKQEALNKLRDLGVTSSADLESDEARLNAKLLQTLSGEISRLEGDVDRYDKAILRVEAKLKDLEYTQLAEGVGLTDEEFVELTTIIHDFDEQLGLDSNNVLDEMEMKDILDQELGIDRKPDQKAPDKKSLKTDVEPTK